MLVRLLALANIAPPRRPPSGYTAWLRHLGAFGLFLVAILDSSPLPTFGGLDILLAILAARHRDPWYYYATVATAGSVAGAHITYRMAHRAGASYLNSKFGTRKVAIFLKYFERWGTNALMVSCLVPLPFPTSAFFASAGVLDYSSRKFMTVVALSRAARYAAIAAIASYYGRHFVRVIRHPDRYLGWLLLIAAGVVVITAAFFWLHRRLYAENGTA